MIPCGQTETNEAREKLHRWSALKAYSRDIAEVAADHGAYRKRASKQSACARNICIREVVSGELAGSARLVEGMFCQQPLTCPHCAARRSAANLRAYIPKLLTLADDCQAYEFHLVTLTLPNGDDLPDMLDELLSGLVRLTRAIAKARARFADGQASRAGPLRNLVGGLIGIEVKRGRGSKLWHPHAHVLVISHGRPDYRAIQQQWGAGCDCRPLHAERERIHGRWARNSDEYRQRLGIDLAEVVKYPQKFEKGAELETWHIAEQLRGRRMLRPFGCLVGTHVDEHYLDEPLDWDVLDWLDTWFSYRPDWRTYCPLHQPPPPDHAPETDF